MALFKRNKNKIIGYNVTFDEGGRTYTYEKNEKEMLDILKDKYTLRGTLPFRVEEVRKDGSKEVLKVTLT